MSEQWRREDEQLVRDLEFKDFAEAMTFVLVHGWNKVRLTLTTHSEAA
jgi:4a-hydroxytetrahydrobiopterin dehydratase